MATTHVLFQAGQMVSKHIDSYLKNVINNAVDMDNGSFVVLNGLVANQGDLWICSTPATPSAQEVFVIDEPIRNLIGGAYAIDVVDPREFYVPVGRIARARKLLHGDSCYLSTTGFVSAPTAGQYAIPTAGSFKLTPSASATGSKIIFNVIASDLFFVGTEQVAGWRLEVQTAV
jgi:hypothetical protein